ncbi:ATP-binding protein [Leptospira noguchii]|uniref:ATP-binding protein n=1 Tax=Leptospira noguchii TaxID=28182 RepID=A0AAE9K8C6_9LEPT|nr:ATP-binding protein [Leptospira noguchii]UOG57015.1 ATP-binding protein [Leptospira noguchii]
MNFNLEILICSVFFYLSSILLWLASTTIVNLEKRNWPATFTITILIVVSMLFGFFSWIGELGILKILNYPAVYFFPGILGLILIPFGWFFIIVWFLGLLKVNYSVFQNFPNGFGKTNILNLLFINLKYRSVKIYFGKTVYYKLCILLLLFSQIFAIVFFLNWSRKFTIDISIFNFWNVVPFSFRLSYLFYILICISIPVVALFIHRTSKKILPEIAKNKAIPYLKTISLLLLGVVILVFFLFLGGEIGIIEDPVLKLFIDPIPFYVFLIGIQFLVSVAVLTLGQALISYEIFTGKILPKIGLRREWRNANLWFLLITLLYFIISSLGFSKIELFLVGSYIYNVSRTSLLKKNKELRLVKSSILNSIITTEKNTEIVTSNLKEKFQRPFNILCSDILETSSALFISKSRIPFVADIILTYPIDLEKTKNIDYNIFKKKNIIFEKENITYLEEDDVSDFVLCLKVLNDHSGEGLLFLGQKENGGLYAEEEIETAKAAVSWILASLFVESNSLTLSSLQKKHIEEQRISDYKTKQILHDEILPEIHSSILILSQLKKDVIFSEQIQLLTNLHKRVSNFLRELPDTGLEIQRLGLIESLIRLTGSEFETSWFYWDFDPDLKHRFPITKPDVLEILFYACRESIRNAVKYSDESTYKKISVIFLKNEEDKKGIVIRIKNKIKTSGTQVLESAGQGLRIHSALLKIFGGYLTLEFLNTDEALVEIFLPEDKID